MTYFMTGGMDALFIPANAENPIVRLRCEDKEQLAELVHGDFYGVRVDLSERSSRAATMWSGYGFQHDDDVPVNERANQWLSTSQTWDGKPRHGNVILTGHGNDQLPQAVAQDFISAPAVNVEHLVSQEQAEHRAQTEQQLASDDAQTFDYDAGTADMQLRLDRVQSYVDSLDQDSGYGY